MRKANKAELLSPTELLLLVVAAVAPIMQAQFLVVQVAAYNLVTFIIHTIIPRKYGRALT